MSKFLQLTIITIFSSLILAAPIPTISQPDSRSILSALGPLNPPMKRMVKPYGRPGIAPDPPRSPILPATPLKFSPIIGNAGVKPASKTPRSLHHEEEVSKSLISQSLSVLVETV